MIQDELQEKVLNIFNEKWGNYAHQRCNDYLSLMYLMNLATTPKEDRPIDLKRLSPDFDNWVRSASNNSSKAGEEADPIIMILEEIIAGYKYAKKAMNVDAFNEKFKIGFNQKTGESDWLSTKRLLTVMRRTARDCNINFYITNASQLGMRMKKYHDKNLEFLQIQRNSDSKNLEYKLISGQQIDFTVGYGGSFPEGP